MADSANTANLPGASAAPESPLPAAGLQPASDPQPTFTAAVREIKTIEPQTLQAPETDVTLARTSTPIEEKPNPAPANDVVALRSSVEPQNQYRGGRHDDEFPGAQNGRDRHDVRQWDRNWVQYDEYYRPVISNPYRSPVRIIYMYLGAPRIVLIPPLARVVLEVAQLAAYSFTAVVDTAANVVDTAAQVAVGTFFGGGYYPGVGLPLPLPPPPLLRYDNVPLQVRYSQEAYQPFRVGQIVDAGDDAVYGERKVLLDGVTPAWGQWTQTASGERLFEVHRTQQFPGLEEPGEGPLPGNYQLSLASDESASAPSGRDVYLMVAAVTMAALSLGAVFLAMALGRRRREN